jgi:hypothetical protein
MSELVELPAAAGQGFLGRLRAFKGRNDGLVMSLFFVGGFLFDAVMLSRIDEPPMLIQQGLYLLVCGALLAGTEWVELRKVEPPGWLRKPWHYAEHVLHFMLGTLLNAYSIFYFQSASGFTAVGLLVVVAALLALNELPRFRRFGPLVLHALYSICLTSYFAYLFPVLMGRIRPWMFYLAVAAATVPLAAHVLLLLRWGKGHRLVARHAIPGFGVQALFVLLYALRVAPPVPLAIKQIGIYHDVQREPGGWRLFHQQPSWKFWQNGDQDFLARPGDKLFCFARIFAPRHFHDGVSIVWFHHEPRQGFRLVHRLPLSVSASSAVGFGTDAYLTEPAPGDWRVEIQSEDGRTIGQLGFHVTADPSTEARELQETYSPSKRLEKR